MQEARSGQTKLGYFTERGRKSLGHDCQVERVRSEDPPPRRVHSLLGVSPMLESFPFQYHSSRVASLEPDRM